MASMARIAEVSNISERKLYSYFDSKQALFEVLVKHLIESTYQTLFSIIREYDFNLPPKQVLAQVATVTLESVSRDQSFLTLIRLIVEESSRFPELAKIFVLEIEKPLLEQLSSYLRFHPNVQVKDPMASARIFVGALAHYLLIQEMFNGKADLPFDSERMIAVLVSQIIGA